MKYLLPFIILTAGCSSTSNKIDYQNNFYIGCRNGHLRYEKPPKLDSRASSDWCIAQYEKVKDR